MNIASLLRLRPSSGGTNGTSSGFLEILVNNTWGTVCNDDFTSVHAEIACRQLGFSQHTKYGSS